MSARPKSAKSATTKASPKELQKKIDELNDSITKLKGENENLKQRLQLICKKIVDNVDMSTYQFIEPNTEPDKIETKDLLHMVQTLGLLATKADKSDGFEHHVESLEYRITELISEQGSVFKNKLKLQERLEFIMQERDVWKRNAETLKKMYEKLVKEVDVIRRPLSASSIVIGAYQTNTDTINKNQRVFSANIPKNYYDNIRASNIEKIQLNAVDLQLLKQLSQIKQASPEDKKTLTTTNNSTNNYNYNTQVNNSQNNTNNFINSATSSNTNIDKSITNSNHNINSTNSPHIGNISPISTNISKLQSRSSSKFEFRASSAESTEYNNLISPYPSLETLDTSDIVLPNHDQRLSKSATNLHSNSITNTAISNSTNYLPDLISIDNYNTEFFERPMTGVRKNVSFNNAIDIRTYPKNVGKTIPNKTHDLRLSLVPFDKESEMENCLNDQQNLHPRSILVSKSPTDFNNDKLNGIISPIDSNRSDRMDLNDINGHSNKTNHQNDNYALFSKPPLNSEGINSISLNNIRFENRFNERANMFQKRKLPGETPVRDLERTLKMVIIKELSAEKLDNNDWKMFAKRIGISDDEISDWISLRLQFPMARVLSVWSSKPEATVRLLHRHLTAPCFNYNLLTKRIETIYDV